MSGVSSGEHNLNGARSAREETQVTDFLLSWNRSSSCRNAPLQTNMQIQHSASFLLFSERRAPPGTKTAISSQSVPTSLFEHPTGWSNKLRDCTCWVLIWWPSIATKSLRSLLFGQWRRMRWQRWIRLTAKPWNSSGYITSKISSIFLASIFLEVR